MERELCWKYMRNAVQSILNMRHSGWNEFFKRKRKATDRQRRDREWNTRFRKPRKYSFLFHRGHDIFHRRNAKGPLRNPKGVCRKIQSYLYFHREFLAIKPKLQIFLTLRAWLECATLCACHIDFVEVIYFHDISFQLWIAYFQQILFTNVR